MRHQFVSPFVGEAAHIAYHFRFLFVNHTLLRTLVQDHFDFLLCHGAFFAFQTDSFLFECGLPEGEGIIHAVKF